MLDRHKNVEIRVYTKVVKTLAFMMEEQLDNMESVLQKICIVEQKPGK